MKRKVIIAALIVVVLTVGIVSAFALNSDLPEDAARVTARFSVEDLEVWLETQASEAEKELILVSEDGELVIHVTDDTAIYFEDYVPLSDECDGQTREVREVLFGRTLAEVLESRNMVVTFLEGEPAEAISIEILFETAVHLPGLVEIAPESGYVGIVTLPAEIDPADFDPLVLNGEIVVNGEMVPSANLPFFSETENVVMAPLRVIAEALGYDVNWDATLRSIRLGVAIHVWVGNTEAQIGRMAPIELSAAPVIIDGVTYVPIDFFRNVLNQTAYVFEGQFVVETYSDMS
ncbi:MAG: copper amine oxidase N-terminal domain-containing protein [Oscillospiraceae bacterium]|nr:copper amine oxidase N-terminal domain-containing protein [Oscillospiraceae bacterium]